MANRFRRVVFSLALSVSLSACEAPPNLTDAIKRSNELRVAVIDPDASMRRASDSATGLEYELVGEYARWLDVPVRFIAANNRNHLRELVDRHRVHFGAAMLRVENSAKDPYRYGPTYAILRYVVVHHRGRPWPKNKNDLIGWNGVAAPDLSLVQIIDSELPRDDGHSWTIDKQTNVSNILRRLENGVIDYAVLPSLEFKLARRNHPELRQAFSLGYEHPIAWYLQQSNDASLLSSQVQFFRTIRSTHEFNELFDRFFGHVDDFNYVESRALLRHFKSRFAKFKNAFIRAGKHSSIDWRLLAALSYQESHWSNDAKSPTGVRGLMMLTRATAEQLNVDRLDPAQSIDGGARYLRSIMDRIPARISEPDRTWFALASYNVGFRNLERARVLADKKGDDPDSWFQVRKYLPKIGRGNSTQNGGRGFSRGYQALHFVARVRQNYEVIKRLEAENPNPVRAQSRDSRAELISPVF